MIRVVRLQVELQNGGSGLPVYVVCWKGAIREQYNKSNYKVKINKGTNPIRRDSFVRTDQSQTSLAGKYCEIRQMKDYFCKDFIRTRRGDWRA